MESALVAYTSIFYTDMKGPWGWLVPVITFHDMICLNVKSLYKEWDRGAAESACSRQWVWGPGWVSHSIIRNTCSSLPSISSSSPINTDNNTTQEANGLLITSTSINFGIWLTPVSRVLAAQLRTFVEGPRNMVKVGIGIQIICGDSRSLHCKLQ